MRPEDIRVGKRFVHKEQTHLVYEIVDVENRLTKYVGPISYYGRDERGYHPDSICDGRWEWCDKEDLFDQLYVKMTGE